MLAKEQEELQIPEEGSIPKPSPGKEEKKAVPKCTFEGAGYLLECWDCRRAGKGKVYVGETSRSPYQRGREHHKEVAEAKKTHTMVLHFQEFHQGQTQQVLMRTMVETRTALDRQVW